MSNELATIIEGVLIMIGVVVAGGAIYAGLQKIADILTKRITVFVGKGVSS